MCVVGGKPMCIRCFSNSCLNRSSSFYPTLCSPSPVIHYCCLPSLYRHPEACRSSEFRLQEMCDVKTRLRFTPSPHRFMKPYDLMKEKVTLTFQIKAIISWMQRKKSAGGCFSKARHPSVWKYFSHCSRCAPRHLCVTVASLKFIIFCST